MSAASPPRRLSLYHYDGCPFCARVREAVARLDVELELRNTLEDPAHARDLMAATGRRTVPCLRIEENGGERWMHESAEIVGWLEREYGG